MVEIVSVLAYELLDDLSRPRTSGNLNNLGPQVLEVAIVDEDDNQGPN